ncbi:hypothetical protein JCM17042A_21000 [Ruminococcus champanellensis 18P13 = JCM 17042]
MVYLMLAVAVVVIVQCVTKRKKQAESHKDAEDIPAVGKHAARMCKRHAKRAAFCRFCIFV